MQQEKKLNKNKIIIILLLIILLVAIISLSYALWTKTFKQVGKNINEFECFNIEFVDGDAFNLENMYPQTDTAGLENTPYEVKMENKCEVPIEYTILINMDLSSTLGDSSVNLGVNKAVYNIGDLKWIKDYHIEDTDQTVDVKKLTTGFLFAKETKTIYLRAWMDENTSEDAGLGKNYKFNVIIDAESATGKGSIAANILLNNKIQVDSGIDFSLGSPACNYDDCSNPKENGSGLYRTEDDDGISYYFRGAVKNNNVEFAYNKWKILRINGDGSIRLIATTAINQSAFNNSGTSYEDYKYVGYTFDNDHACTHDNPCISDYDSRNGGFTSNYGDNSTKDSDAKKALEGWYEYNMGVYGYGRELVLGTYCNDTSPGKSSGMYSPNDRLNSTPSLKCPDPIDNDSGFPVERNFGGVYKLKIGLISSDEASMAGLGNYYSSTTNSDNYLYNLATWTMSPAYSGYLYSIGTNLQCYVNNNSKNSTTDIRPVVNLRDNIEFTGTGTEKDPYKIKTDY